MKKIMMMLCLTVFLISLASAADFDNIQTYDSVSRTYTIENWFGLGEDLATIRLSSPLNVLVPRGYQKVAEFELYNFKKDYSNAFRDMNFYQISDGKEITRNFDYKYLSYEWEDKKIYGDVCEQNKENNSVSCHQEEIKTEKILSPVWIKFSDINELPSSQEKFTIGIFTIVQPGDKVEWIPTLFGERLTEWATWTESLNVNLDQYWAFEDNAANNTVHAQVGTNGAIASGNTNSASVIGRVNNGFDFDGGTSDYVVVADCFDVGADFAISLWLKPDSLTNQQNFFDATGNIIQLIMSDGVNDGKIRILIDGVVDFKSTTGLTAGAWNHVVLTHDNGVSTKIYINGLLNGSATGTSSGSCSAIKLANYAGDKPYLGVMDEPAIWAGRILSQSEITQLYNNGLGLTYTDVFDQNPNITLHSPSSANFTIPQNIQLNFTAWDDIELSSVQVYVNNILNQTNASGVNNTVYLFNLSLGEGDFTIYGKATDNASHETNSSSIRIVIDATAPTISSSYNLTDLLTFDLPVNSTWSFNASDQNLGSCYYNTSDQATTTITCNSTIQTLWNTDGNKTITFCANDTFGFESCNSENIFINYIQANASFESPGIEGQTYDFYFNLTATQIDSFNGSIFWNGTEYPTTASSNSTYGLLSSSITLPLINNTQNVGIFWNYDLNGISYNSSNFTQTITFITPINVSTSCTDKAMQFILKDEGNQTILNADVDYNFQFGLGNATQKTVYGSLSNAATFFICINASIGNYTVGSGELQYKEHGTGYVQRRYYLFENKILSNETENVTIYDLVNGDATSFLFETSANDLSPYIGKYLGLLRWYPELNSYGLVEMAKTDEDGRSIMRVKVEDVDYRVALYELNGSLIDIQDPTRFACLTSPCTYDFSVVNTETDFTSATGIEQSLTFNETTNTFLYIWNDPSGKTQTMTLNVTRETGVSVGVICSETGSGSTGVLACDVTGYTGQLRAVVYRTASPATPIASLLHTVGQAISSVASDIGLLFSAVLAIIGFFIGVFNPILGIIFQIAALIPSVFMGAITMQILVGVAVMGIIVIHFMKRVIGG